LNRKNPRQAIFLDRDGVISKEIDLLCKPSQIELISGAAEAIKLINRSGYLAIIVTNQPVIARNLCSIDELNTIHNTLETLLGKEHAFVDAIYYCPHHPHSGYPEERKEYKIECECRKPKPGMLLKAALEMYNLNGVDINSIADVPSGTGLGSSSSFTVGLLNAIKAYQNIAVSHELLASKACHIEIDVLKSPIGKQDQYAAAYGGLNFISFHPDETVNVEKIIMNPVKKKELEENLIMIYTGDVRSANTILQQQSIAIEESDKFDSQEKMVSLAYDLKNVLENNQIDEFGRILHEGWLLKKSLISSISNTLIDDIYNKGIGAGALGGKLLGAGGGGFVLFYCPKEKQESFRLKMKDFREFKFGFDNFGSKIIYIGDNDNGL
jgi:D-glycero-alpha-D-manno-heptose-7-phosphate kinase